MISLLSFGEKIAWSIALLCVAIMSVAVLSIGSADSDVIASWVQAIGSIAAVFIVTVPVLLQRKIESQDSRRMVLAAVELTWSYMNYSANRYLGIGEPESEWAGIDWPLLLKSLSDAPIHQTGSAAGLQAFLEFQSYAAKAPSWDTEVESFYEEGSRPLVGLVGFAMTNAASARETLRRALAT
jgi:hypothetical protein